ncbi:MAG: hypothetical protein WC780_03365 [Lentimicrobiaceae bacterium]|jgi:hypothetical protein
MIKVKKEGSKVSKTYNSTMGYNRIDRTSKHAEVREKPYMVPEVDFEAQGEELHWMAYAAYNQSK